MALKWLTAEEMVSISSPWVVTGQKGRTAIEKTPLLAALLPKLETGHAALVSLLSKEAPKVSAISQKQTELDAKHDSLVRGMVGTLTMLAPISEDREELLAIRDKLFPEGLGHTKLSYRGEAGHTAVVFKLMDDAIKARLKAIVVHKKTMLDLALAWIEMGNQLGQLEEEKAHLLESSPSLGAEIRAARMGWVRLAKALMANAKLADIDGGTDQLLFSALRTAERAADSRAHGKTVPAPAPTPVTDPTT
jgi:hypothetical protein